jgi:hypothetical protein
LLWHQLKVFAHVAQKEQASKPVAACFILKLQLKVHLVVLPTAVPQNVQIAPLKHSAKPIGAPAKNLKPNRSENMLAVQHVMRSDTAVLLKPS